MPAELKILPDPRPCVTGPDIPIPGSPDCKLPDTSASRQEEGQKSVDDWAGRMLVEGDDTGIAAAFSRARGDRAHRELAEALDRTLEAGAGLPTFLRLFALPILIVTGGRDAQIPGVLPEVQTVQQLLEEHRALGESRCFGLSNAMVSARQLAALKPSLLYRFVSGNAGQNFAALDLVPDAIAVMSPDERVHLRFLVGACIATAQMPGADTAGRVGTWGMPFTKMLASGLAQEGLSLLPIPRAPMSVHRALAAGMFAERELGFQLFLSKALRQFRASVGEPDTHVGSFMDGSVRVRFSSPFNSAREEFVWPLAPADDLRIVSSSILSLLEECRVFNVQIAETVQGVSVSQ